METNKQNTNKDIDWGITLIPLVIIALISAGLMLNPDGSAILIEAARNLFVNQFGFFLHPVRAGYPAYCHLAGIFQIRLHPAWPDRSTQI